MSSSSPSAARIEELPCSQLILQGLELGRTLLEDRFVHGFLELLLVLVKEKRVDDLMDVLNARVVHPTMTACIWIQGTLEDCTEDGRADLAPVEVAGVLQNQAARRLVHRRNWNFLGEKAAIVPIDPQDSAVKPLWRKTRFRYKFQLQ